MILRPYQESLKVEVYAAWSLGLDNVLAVLPTGGGKCLGAGTPVLMFDGTIKPVEQVRVGDLLMGPDSIPRSVLSTCHGVEPLYRVTPTKGEPYVVNESHILSLRNESGGIKNVSVLDYLAEPSHWKMRNHGWRVPGILRGDLSFELTGVTVEPIGPGDYYGFEIDGDRLFMLGDFTVTHNTVVFSSVLAEHSGAACAMAHRQELVSQISLTLGRNGIRHGIVAADSTIRNIVRMHLTDLGRSWYDPNSQVRVASVDTLIRMDPNDPWLKRVSLWVCDEAHHPCYAGHEPNKWAKATLMMPNSRGLGVTATPIRADGRGLGRHADGIFDYMVLGPYMRDLIKEGFLTDYRVFCPPSDIDLSQVTISASGDYSPEKLRDAVHKSHIVGDVVGHYLKIAPGQRGITFCVDIESATDTCAAYRQGGVPAEMVSSKTPDLLRQQVLNRFKSGDVRQLVNVDLFGEGFDLPALEVVSMARPTQSFSLYAQQFGRALRILEGKTTATVIDHVGNVLRHGLPDAPRTWSLDRRERKSKSASPSDAVPLRACPECSQPYERVLPACPWCGHEPQPTVRSSPEAVEGDLHQLSPEVLARMRGEVLALESGPKFPLGATMEVVGAIKRRWMQANEARGSLAEAMALWGGKWHEAGDTDRMIQRRFYLAFGVDVLSAQALSRSDSVTLESQIRSTL